MLDQLKVTRTNLAGFYIKTSVTWHEILILIDVQLSDSSSDEVAEAFCLGQRRGCRTERAEKPAKRCPRWMSWLLWWQWNIPVGGQVMLQWHYFAGNVCSWYGVSVLGPPLNRSEVSLLQSLQCRATHGHWHALLPPPCWHPGRSALSRAWHIQCCACLAANFEVSPKKGFFFFFNSCFQFSGDSDTAARIKWSSSPSELYSRRPWVSSLKESLVSPAINWIQFFNLTDGTRYSSSAVCLLAQGLCFSNRPNDSYEDFVLRNPGEGRLEGNE